MAGTLTACGRPWRRTFVHATRDLRLHPGRRDARSVEVMGKVSAVLEIDAVSKAFGTSGRWTGAR